MNFLLKATDLSIGHTHPLHEGLNFHLYEGDIMFVKGNNGTGKSTLVKTILGETQQHFPEAPLVLVANKQDKDEALPPEEVAKWIEVPEILPLSCKSTRDNCEEIILNLLRKIEDNRIKFSENILE